jgi:hypothetical protein
MIHPARTTDKQRHLIRVLKVSKKNAKRRFEPKRGRGSNVDLSKAKLVGVGHTLAKARVTGGRY